MSNEVKNSITGKESFLSGTIFWLIYKLILRVWNFEYFEIWIE